MAEQVFGGRCRVDSELGRGGMGVVYPAYDLLLQRNVAIKTVSRAGLSADLRADVLREARSNAQLDHPNIASVHDVVESDDHSCIVMHMQYVDGVTLSERPSGSAAGSSRCLNWRDWHCPLEMLRS